MSRVAINTGSVANDGTGDSLRIAGGIINDNFSEIYSQFGDGTNLTPTWDKTAAGINTTSSVGIGTTNPRFTLEVGAVGASGTSLWVNGNARVTGILTVGSSSIVLDGNANKILVGSGISFDGNTGIISATAFYAGGSIISGGGSGGGLNYWGSSASGISTTANVAIGTVTPTSKLTVVGNSLFSGIATFRNNLTLANLTSSSNTLRFGSNSYIDQSNSDVVTFQITSGTDGSGTDSSFVFRTTEPGVSPIPDQAYDALRVYSGGDYWNRLVRVYTNFHADNDAFVGGDLQVGAASTLIGAGSTLGSFKVGSGGTVITTTSTGLVGIGTTNPTSKLTVKGNTSLETLSVSGVSTFTIGGAGNTEAVYFQSKTQPQASLKISQAAGNDDGVLMTFSSSDGDTATIETDSNSNLVISTQNTLNLRANTNQTVLQSGGSSVDLYYSGIKKFETLGAGVTVTGTTFTNQLSVSGVSTFQAFNSYVEMGNPSYYAGLRLISGATEARILQSGAGDLYLDSHSNRNVRLNTYAMFGDSNSLGNVQLNTGNVGDTKVGSAITFTSNTGNVYATSATVGIVTGATYYGDTSNTTDGRWTLGANGTSDYTFTGIGFTQTTNDPILYLARGRVYEFVNNSGGAHPFEIRVSNGGAAYSDGVTNNAAATGVIRFEIPFNAPNILYYQCTVHSGMGNTISVYPDTI